MKKIITAIALIVVIIILGGLVYGFYKKATVKSENPIVTMEVKDYGTIKIELYPEKAPNTVKNFVALAKNGFYNGLKFHRVIKDFMIQGGDHEGTGTGAALVKYFKGNDDETKYAIKGEMTENGFKQNDLNLTQGVIAMARGDYTQASSSLREESYNSAGTQFFIMTTDNYVSLDGLYAGFGKVIEGMDVVTKIAETKVVTKTEYDKAHSEEKEDEENKNSDSSESSSESAETPLEDVIMSSVTVDTKGIDYGYPEVMKPFNYTKWLYNRYGLEYDGED